MGNIRIGIDVGGTFTHAVALDDKTQELISQSKVLTTHTSPLGVAEGIIQSLKELLSQSNINPEQISFIAHSTTQATNALLEGDVAKVGIIGMGKGLEGKRAKNETNIGQIELSGGKYLTTFHFFLDTSTPPSNGEIEEALNYLINQGAEVFVASEAFATDEPINEQKVIQIIQKKELLAVAASDISGLYGLKIRTRTAAINASILPKMIEAATKTEEAVKEAGITVPLMVMRSDGGVMSLKEVKQKPILTLLSGPAAGVAAALMFAKVSEGIFVEVGGTSTDISVIHHGKAQIKSAHIGGHRTYLETLDVRTVGTAGGSIPRINLKEKTIIDLGPRSAHIASLPYISFTTEQIKNLTPQNCSPKKGDPEDYLIFSVTGTQSGSQEATFHQYALTTTGLSNFLGFVKKEDYAYSTNPLLREAIDKLSNILGKDPSLIAKNLLKQGLKKLNIPIWNLIKEYKLNENLINFVGGGGGAGVLVPLIKRTKKEEDTVAPTNYHHITKHAEVISAIGVALALMREVIRKTIINPTKEDIKNLHQQAINLLLKNGAKEETIEVNISIDHHKNIVEVEAVGSRELREQKINKFLSLEEQKQIIKNYLLNDIHDISFSAETSFFKVWEVKKEQKFLFSLIKNIKNFIIVLDANGLVRFSMQSGSLRQLSKQELISRTKDILDKEAVWGDAGVVFPKSYIFISGRILDLSKLYSWDQIKSFLELELSSYPNEEKAVLVVEKK